MHEFTVWAPYVSKVAVKTNDDIYPMQGPDETGWWSAKVEGADPGTDYAFLLDDDPMPYPDPRSPRQPNGVHGPSRVVDHKAFHWNDTAWQGPPILGAVIYELHVGTFTREGTFDSATERLEYLHTLGITHIELMPVAAFPGQYGWGYDGAELFAVQEEYGGPDGLKRLVNACHLQGIGVLIDVVYNHFGPVGSYASRFGPYLNDRHHTPWGDAVNFEEAGSDEVRRFFCDNALMWMRDYHVDGLRIGEAAGDRDGLPCHRGNRRIMVEVIAQVAVRCQGPGSVASRLASVGALEQNAERFDDFGAVATQIAEPFQPGRQPQAGLGTVRIGDAERQRVARMLSNSASILSSQLSSSGPRSRAAAVSTRDK